MRLKTGIGEFAQLEHPTSRFTIELNYFLKNSEVFEPFKRGTELDHFGFEVDDVDKWVRKLVRAGGKIKIKPTDGKLVIHDRGNKWFKGRYSYVSDPDNIWIELMGPPSKGLS
jgi:catechol 2,3-dioxygenase-like lactoylglutathione lyase family enzyme